MIFKVQRSLFTTEPTQQLLIYNASRKNVEQRDITSDEADALFEPNENKVFYHGRVVDGKIELTSRADWQDW